MRLTILNQFYVPDLAPTAHLAASLAEHRAALGDSVVVVTGSGGYTGGAAPASRSSDNPRIIRLWTPSLGKASLGRRLLDYLSFFVAAARTMASLPRQDVVVSMTTPPYIGLLGAAHKLLNPGARLLLWNMDCYPDVAERAGAIRPGGLISRVLRTVNRWLFARLDGLVALDHAMEGLLRAEGARPRTPIHVIPNWERLRDFPDDGKAAPWSKAEELGLRGRFVVLYGGNAGAGHRFETVLEAARQLLSEPITFLFVGGGSQFTWIEREAAGLSNVILHPYVSKDEMTGVLALAQCALITMRDDMAGVVSPSKLHSALATRLPVLYVGPAAGNVHEAVTRYGCGESVRNGDATSAVAFLRRLLRGEAELRDKARRAFEDVYCDRAGLRAFDALLR